MAITHALIAVAMVLISMHNVNAFGYMSIPEPRGGVTSAQTPPTPEMSPYILADFSSYASCGLEGGFTNGDQTTAGTVPTLNTLTAGSNLEVNWSIVTAYTGSQTNRVRISVLYPGAAGTFTDHILYETSISGSIAAVGPHITTVVVPNIDCTGCVLQWMWASQLANKFFITCADINITGATSTPTPITAPTPVIADDCTSDAECLQARCGNPPAAGCTTPNGVCRVASPRICVRSTILQCLIGTHFDLRVDTENADPVATQCADNTYIFCQTQTYGIKVGDKLGSYTSYQCARKCTTGIEVGARIPGDVTGASADIISTCCETNDCNTKAVNQAAVNKASVPCNGGCGVNGACQNGVCRCDPMFAGVNCEAKLALCDATKKDVCFGLGVKLACTTADLGSGCKWCTLPGLGSAVCIYAPNVPCYDQYGGNTYNVGGGGCQPGNFAFSMRNSHHVLGMCLAFILSLFFMQ